MNRCVAISRSRATLPALALALAAAFTTSFVPAPADAQVLHRNFPKTALRGMIAFGSSTEATLNGHPIRLAPGARIHGVDNMMVMSGTLIGQKFPADYTLESTGMLFEVWLLTKDEAAVQPWPRTPQEAATWSFDYAAQRWTER